MYKTRKAIGFDRARIILFNVSFFLLAFLILIKLKEFWFLVTFVIAVLFLVEMRVNNTQKVQDMD
jgi:hypothetical protein